MTNQYEDLIYYTPHGGTNLDYLHREIEITSAVAHALRSDYVVGLGEIRKEKR